MEKLSQKRLKALSTSDLLDRYEFAVGRAIGAVMMLQYTEYGTDSRESKIAEETETEATKIRHEIARRLLASEHPLTLTEER